MDITKPSLTEPGVKYFLNGVLKQCKEKRVYFNNSLFNLSMLCLFIIIIGSFLFYNYRGKLSPQEKELKKQQQKQDILSKLNQINVDLYKGSKNASLITDLPVWNNSDVKIDNQYNNKFSNYFNNNQLMNEYNQPNNQLMNEYNNIPSNYI